MTTTNNLEDDKTLTTKDVRQIEDAANEIMQDSGWGKLTVEFRDGEIHLIEVTVTRMRFNRAKRF